MELEICCPDVESLVTAVRAGVRRVELCADLASGGVTPSAGMIRMAVTAGIPSVNVLIRPRGGDFLYSAEEVDMMSEDIRAAAAIGATGAVIGALTREGDLDADIMQRLIATARNAGLEVIVSRALDLTPDPLRALRHAIALGADRVLTSGGAATVDKGLRMLAQMQRVAVGTGRVIMAGGGVNTHSIPRLAAAGITAVHTTAAWGPRPVTSHVDTPAGFGHYDHPRANPTAILEIQHAIENLDPIPQKMLILGR